MDEFETSMKVLLRLTRKQRQRVPVPPGRARDLRPAARLREPALTRRMACASSRDASDARFDRFPAEYFERLVESSPDIVVAVDRTGTDHLLQRRRREEPRLHGGGDPRPERRHALSVAWKKRIASWRRCAATSTAGRARSRASRPPSSTAGASSIPVAISGSILYDENGLEIGSIGFAKDIRDIRRSDRLATLGEVAVALCHEINSPLEVILNEVELLDALRAPMPPRTSEAVVEEERVEAVRREVQQDPGDRQPPRRDGARRRATARAST